MGGHAPVLDPDCGNLYAVLTTLTSVLGKGCLPTAIGSRTLSLPPLIYSWLHIEHNHFGKGPTISSIFSKRIVKIKRIVKTKCLPRTRKYRSLLWKTSRWIYRHESLWRMTGTCQLCHLVNNFFLLVACIVLAQCRGMCNCGWGDMAVIMKK